VTYLVPNVAAHFVVCTCTSFGAGSACHRGTLYDDVYAPNAYFPCRSTVYPFAASFSYRSPDSVRNPSFDLALRHHRGAYGWFRQPRLLPGPGEIGAIAMLWTSSPSAI